jgi:hypothetical protein
MRMHLFVAAALVALIGNQGGADMNLVQDGRSDYCIVLSKDASPSEHWAASELKQFIGEMSGAVLQYAEDNGQVPQKAILLGDSKALQSLGVNVDFADLGEEGFTIKTIGDRIIIAGGRLRGTMYGAYEFLERLGCRFLTDTVNKVPKTRDITVGALDITQKPVFEYRDVYIREAMTPNYAARNRGNSFMAKIDRKRGGNIAYYPFVHSFNQLVPLEKYWDTHPEYFSEIEGKRIKDHTQLCMSNPEVVKIATETVLKWMHDHPEARIYSVSQNDWYNNCQCPNCKAIDEEEGSPSGLMLRFVNAIAEETSKVYPDKLIDTLAYQWTEKPPKITKLHPNVRVRLCPIFCCESHPYETCGTNENKAFIDNLLEWGKITDQLYIWHYNTSFAHYLNPFPDFWQLMDTAKLYKRQGVKGIFWEGSYPPGGGGEMAHLRSYLLSKITWDPDIDGNEVMREFCDDYYGKSGKYIYEYVQLLLNKVTKDHIHMKIWATPTDPFLTPEIVAASDKLFDKAEAAAESEEILDRVKHDRIPIQYVKLMQPIMNKQVKGKEAEYLKKLDDFVALCKSRGMTHISEWEDLGAYHERMKKAIEGKE